MGIFNRISQILSDQRSNRGKAFSKAWEGPFDITISETGNTIRHARSLNVQKVEEFNAKLMAWGEKVKAALIPSISGNDIKGKKLARSIKNTYYYEFGEIYRLGFSFKREGIFIHKGVGRGYRMSGDEVIKIAQTPGFNRHPKPWFNPVVANHIEELREIVRDYAESAVLNTMRIFIR